MSRGLPEGIELQPWGWTNRLRQWGRENGWICNAPDQIPVQVVNSRRFSFGLEKEWDCALAGECEVQSVEELKEAVARLPDSSRGWVLKAEFGMAARERVIVRPGENPEKAYGWIGHMRGMCDALYFEPWVERIAEVGIQFSVPESGEPEFVGITPLLCDAQGQYRGSRFAESESLRNEWSDAIDLCRRAARRAQERGYFGPMGIDAMRYRDAAGVERVRPIQDINARLTMGRVSLGLRRLLRSGEVGSWLHLRNPSRTIEATKSWYEALAADLPAGARLIRTSPLQFANNPVGHATVALFAPDGATLEQIEQSLFSKQRKQGEPRA